MFNVEGGVVFKKQTKMNRGRGVKPICTFIRSVKKISWFFKQQTEFFLTSSLPVAKSFSVFRLFQHMKVDFLLKTRGHFFFKVFLWTCKYFYCHCIYDCGKNINLLSFESTKRINYFLCFHSQIFHSKIHKCHGTFFWEGW